MYHSYRSNLYISRFATRHLEADFIKSCTAPSKYPLVIYISGLAGVGKTTLLDRLTQEIHEKEEVEILQVTFGRPSTNESIATPLKLMSYLYEQISNVLRKKTDRKSDSFTKLYDQYCSTTQQLITQSADKQLSTPSNANHIKQLLKLTAKGLPAISAALTGMEPLAAGVASLTQFTTDKNIDWTVDSAEALVHSIDPLSQLLQKHYLTRKNKSLQKLILNPITSLTQAFIKDLITHTKYDKRQIIIRLDAFEKASLDINKWLSSFLSDNQKELQEHNIRIVIAGQMRLKDNQALSSFRQEFKKSIFEKNLDRFSLEETQEYLEKSYWSNPDDIQWIFPLTGGLPYYLDWICEQHYKGEKIDPSQGTQAISQLFLKTLTRYEQAIIIRIACCRYFDRSIIKFLLKQVETPYENTLAQNIDLFGWLQQQNYVQIIEGKYQFDDVVRDVFQKFLKQEDRESFHNTHFILAEYYKNRANQLVASDCPEHIQYQNPDWCESITEYLYHLLLSEHSDRHSQFLNYLFASHYLKTFEVVTNVFIALTSEDILLSAATQKYLQDIQPLFNKILSELIGFKISQVMDFLTQKVLSKTQDQERIKQVKENSKALGDYLESELRNTLFKCRNYIDQLKGLGKYTFLLYQSHFVSIPEEKSWLKLATDEANKLTSIAFPDVSSDIYQELGKSYSDLKSFEDAIASYDKALEFKPNSGDVWYIRGVELHRLGRFEAALKSADKALEFEPDNGDAWSLRSISLGALEQVEEALSSADKALEFKPDNGNAWYSRGIALIYFERFEEALKSTDKALEFKPDNGDTWYSRGLALDKLGRFDEAIASYDKALEFKPDYVDAWTNRGVALRNLGRFEDEIASYDKALQFKPDLDEAWNNRGVALGNLGRFDDEITSYDKALQFKPDLDQAWYNRGVALGNLGRFEDAITSYDKALQFKPDLDQAWYNRGVALGNLGRFEDAIASYDKALQFKPDLDQAWNNRGVALGNLGRFEDAITSYDKALQFKPDLDQAWYNRGIALGKLGRFDDAITSYDKALQFKPDDDLAWNNRGWALDELGRYEDAIASYDKALQFKPDDDLAWNNRGNALGNLGRFEEAIASYDKALKFKPDYDQAWYNRGIALVSLGRFDDAIASYDKALKFKPDDDQAWYNRGVALGNLGRFDDAISSYDKALQFKPDYDQAWYNRGLALGNLGRFEGAIASFDKALKFKPDNDQAWYNRGLALGELGRFDDAIASFDKALQFKPDKDEAWNNRGFALDELGRFDDAIASYDKALQFKPDYDQAWNNRGVALGNLGRFDDAITSYDKALEINPEDPNTCYNKACCYALQANAEDAVENLKIAISFAPEEYREMAKTDSDFDPIRGNEAFQALLMS